MIGHRSPTCQTRDSPQDPLPAGGVWMSTPASMDLSGGGVPKCQYAPRRWNQRLHFQCFTIMAGT